jgi:competence protein ComEA
MKSYWGIAFGVVCGLLGAGILLLAISKPRGEPIQLVQPPTPAPVMVHVAGAVNEPGVHSLPYGSRVKDAIEKSGGLQESADTDLINLAMPVSDGMQIWVPALQVDTISQVDDEQAGQLPEDFKRAKLVNINTASQAELETLTGIGPVTAQSIIQFRQENGPFQDVAEIQSVTGIGPVKFEKIQPYITVGGAKSD